MKGRDRGRTGRAAEPSGAPDIVEIGDPDYNLRNAIVTPLEDYLQEQGFPFSERRIAFGLMRDGSVDGGLLARIVWDWMYVEILSVPSAIRRMGHGRRLMARAEAEARDQGCRGVWVDTFTFQAPGFYERLGYELFGELPDHPVGQARRFYRKLLD